MNEATDEEGVLVRRAQARDAAAFAELIRPYRRQIEALCWRLTDSRDDAQDAVQEALVALWRSLPGFEGRSQFRTWMYRVVRNAAVGVARAPRLTVIDLEADDDSTTPAVFPAANDATEDVTDRMLVEWLLPRLDPDHRAVLVFSDLLGLSHAEIAAIEGVAAATVGTRLFRARRAAAILLGGTRRTAVET